MHASIKFSFFNEAFLGFSASAAPFVLQLSTCPMDVVSDSPRIVSAKLPRMFLWKLNFVFVTRLLLVSQLPRFLLVFSCERLRWMYQHLHELCEQLFL